MLNRVLAALAGVVVAFGLVAAIEALGHTIYPPPAGLDFSDADTAGAYIASLPPMAVAFVLLAWLVGTFGGALVATLISTPRRPLAAFVVTALVLAAGAANMVMIPHPLWFMLAAVAGIPLAGFAAWKILAPAALPPAS